MKGIYLVGGYPDSDTFNECVRAVARCGFDFIEIGIPFNDPIADGPVIASAILEALAQGVTPDRVMQDICLAGDVNIKKYVMTYANIIYSYDMKKFSDTMAGSLNGAIIPDLPNRMSAFFYDGGFGIPIVPFATLETRQADVAAMNTSQSEMIYFVGVRGITGSAADLGSHELAHKSRMIRDNTDKKIMIGFGIKTAADARKALEIGDGFVVGTEAVKRQNDPAELKNYLQSLLKGA